jgi:hypothetical protein
MGMDLDNIVLKGRLYKEYRDVLKGLEDDFEFFITLTFKRKINNLDQGWNVISKFRLLLDKYGFDDIKGYVVGERSEFGLIHFHCLLYNCKDGFSDVLKLKWGVYNGMVDVKVFEKCKGGEDYILKGYMNNEFSMLNWEVL